MAKQKYKIDKVWLTENYREGLIDIGWSSRGIGSGHLSFHNDKKQIICNSEFMNRNFVKAVLNELVEQSVFKNRNNGKAI